MCSFSLVRKWIALVLASAPALAADWYVDAVNGRDSNTGTSPTDAWKSITWALGNTPATGVQRVHIAPGGYGHTTEEHFPLALRPDVHLIGTPGPVRPVIGHSAGLSYFTPMIGVETLVGDVLPPNAEIRIENLEFSRGRYGVVIHHNATGSLAIVVRDVRFREAGAGIQLETTAAASFAMQLDRVRYENSLSSFTGVWVRTGLTPSSTLHARDCTFVGGSAGVSMAGEFDARFERCRIEGTVHHGVNIAALQGATPHASFESCLIAESNNHGVRFYGPAGSSLKLERCTIADNCAYGLRVQTATGANPAAIEIDQCIFANGAIDLVLPPGAIVRDSLIRDGQLAGVNGNFSADPLFADPSSGDWGLSWSSPCIDRIADASVASLLDLTGRLRGVDGDLDTLERSDLGATEFRPLAAPLQARIASSLSLGSWGPQGAASTIYWARSAPVGPTSTPFGSLALPPAALRIFSVTSTGAASPTVLQRPVPNVLSLVGQTYSFQALVDSPAAPQGRAYTNVAPVTFVF
jgi:hypothetical protein